MTSSAKPSLRSIAHRAAAWCRFALLAALLLGGPLPRAAAQCSM